VDLGVVGTGLDEAPQRLEGVGEIPCGLKLADLGDGIRGPAAHEQDANEENQRREQGRAARVMATGMDRHGSGT
jgi:hypothetical protein